MRMLGVLGASLVMLSLVLASVALAAEKADTGSLASAQQAGAASVEATADCNYEGDHFDGYFCGDPPVVIEVAFSKTGSSACSYDATIDWDDGTTTTLTNVQDGQKTSHEYTKPGVYIIQVTADVHSSDPKVTCTFDEFTLVAEVAGPPSVRNVDPPEDATEVSRSTDVSATFSEEMDPGTINSSTVKLINTKSGKRVPADVSCDDPCQTATLDPSVLLAENRKYKAVVTTGAKDLGGNALDQRPNKPGNQPKVWFFTTGSGS